MTVGSAAGAAGIERPSQLTRSHLERVFSQGCQTQHTHQTLAGLRRLTGFLKTRGLLIRSPVRFHVRTFAKAQLYPAAVARVKPDARFEAPRGFSGVPLQ